MRTHVFYRMMAPAFSVIPLLGIILGISCVAGERINEILIKSSTLTIDLSNTTHLRSL